MTYTPGLIDVALPFKQALVGRLYGKETVVR